MPAGRPRKQAALDEAQVEYLASIGCSDAEIAIAARVSEASLKRHYAPLLKKGRVTLKISLRRAQLERAMAGSDTMLIWLGKNILGQHDRIAQTISGEEHKPLVIATYDYGAAAAALASGSGADRDDAA